MCITKIFIIRGHTGIICQAGCGLDANRKELLTIRNALGGSRRGMTILEISKAVGLNRHSVAKYLEVLVAAGQVDMRAFGTSKIFSISQRIPISAMLSFSSDLIITLDKDLLVRYVNDRFLGFMGLKRETILGKNIGIFSQYMQTQPPLLPFISSALEGTEGSVDIFYPGVEKRFHFIMKTLPTIFEDGGKGVTLILGDITARVEAEEALRKERAELEVRVKERTAELEAEIAKRISYENALRESEEKFRVLAETTKAGIGFYRGEKRIYVNPAMEKITGYTSAELLAMTLWDNVHPDYRVLVERRISDRQRGLDVPASYELPIIRKDGEIRWIELAAGRIMYQGEPTGIGTYFDITERKRAEAALRGSEEKYRNLVENVNDVVWEIDAEGRFTYISPKIRDVMGYEPSEFIGKTIAAFLSPAYAKEITDDFEKIFGEPEPYSLQETRVLHKDGHEMIVEANGIVVYDGQGCFKGYRGIIRDITARKGH